MSRKPTNKKSRTGNPPSNISITKKTQDPRNLESSNIFNTLEHSPRTPEPWKFELPENNVAPKVSNLEKVMAGKECHPKTNGKNPDPNKTEPKDDEIPAKLNENETTRAEQTTVNDSENVKDPEKEKLDKETAKILERVLTDNAKVKPKRVTKKPKRKNNLESLIINMNKNMNKNFRNVKEELGTKINNLEETQNTKINELKERMDNVEKRVDEKNDENQKKIVEAMEKVDKKVTEINDVANAKILEMSIMVEQMKEMKAQAPEMNPITNQNLGARQKTQEIRQPQTNNSLPPGPPIQLHQQQRPTHAQVLMKKPENLNQQRNLTPINTNEKPVIKHQKTKTRFINRLDERRQAFQAALEWIGVFMTREEILAWIGDPSKEQWTDRKILKCQSCDGARRNAVTEKIENHTSLHYEDILIHEYYVSTNNGFIFWMRLDAFSVDLILKQTSKIPSRQFKAVPYIPDIARNKKKNIDMLLMEYKKSVNENLRYIIKNDLDDLKILVRSYDEFDHVPYREMCLETLGKLPELECITKSDTVPEAVMLEAEDPDKFRLSREERKRKQRKSPKKLSRERIFERITRFLGGFEVDPEQSTDEESLELELVEEEDEPEGDIETNV